jgi:hypothetical protein
MRFLFLQIPHENDGAFGETLFLTPQRLQGTILTLDESVAWVAWDFLAI